MAAKFGNIKIPALFVIFLRVCILVICNQILNHEEMECWFDDGDEFPDYIGTAKE